MSLTSVARDQQAIETLARALQALPEEVRWVYSQQDVIRATATRKALRPGIRTAWIRRTLKALAKIGLAVVAAKLASLVFLLAIRCRQARLSASETQRRFFIGISALKEAELVTQFETMEGGRATVIDQRFSGALAAIYRPSLSELLRAWSDAARPIFANLTSADGSGSLDRSAVLVYAVRRLHHYAHFLAAFRGLNSLIPGATVAFSTADLPAYAAVHAGVDAIYFPHGFQSRSLVYPDFKRVVQFNAPEAEHIQARLPQTEVSVPAPTIRPIRVARRLAVIGDYGDKLERSRSIIEFCRTAAIDVVVRPHPADRSGYWTTWQEASGVVIDRGGTFDAFLDRHRPCVITTWYSTTIYDALLRGVVPVTLEADQADLVFPLTDVALRWPEQMQQIRAVLADPRARHDALGTSLARTIGNAHARAAMQEIEACGCDLQNGRDPVYCAQG